MNMNKRKNIIFFSILLIFSSLIIISQISNTGILFAPDTPNVAENACDEESIRRVLKILGFILLIVRVCIPLIIIGYGTVDLFKSVIDKDEKSFGKQIKQIIVRIVCGLIIFFLPNFINAIFTISDRLNIIEDEQYKTCADCILKPGDNSRCRVD